MGKQWESNGKGGWMNNSISKKKDFLIQRKKNKKRKKKLRYLCDERVSAAQIEEKIMRDKEWKRRELKGRNNKEWKNEARNKK